MNKRGTSIFFLLMMGVVFFILGLALAPAINTTVYESTHSTELNCSATSITDQQQSVCTSMETFNLYTGVIFGLGGMLLVAVGIR